MKYSIIAAFVLLALAQGSLSQDAPDLQKVAQLFDEMKVKLTASVQQLTESTQGQDLAKQAQTMMDEGRSQLEPLLTQVRDQVAPLAASMQEQIQPMLEDFQSQMEGMLQKMMAQARALGQGN